MKVSKIERLSLYSAIKKKLDPFSKDEIESGVMLYCLTKYGCNAQGYQNERAEFVSEILEQADLPTDLETIIELFESLLEEDKIDENGIVFTPQFIAEYITESALKSTSLAIKDATIIDPGCGCGIFLVTAAEYILEATSKQIDSIIEENIFGIDIEQDNVRRCKCIMTLLSAKHGGNYEKVQPNIICEDSLKTRWSESFSVEAFNYIVGNPPYVNPHDMTKETVHYLKNHYCTTKSGVFNIFYAFIEKGMEELHSEGILSFIIPNNFLTIKSALKLREYLQSHKYVKSILDFGDNMVFKPIRTYNCIIQLSKSKKSAFEYCVLPKADDIEKAITEATFNCTDYHVLDKNGWKLVDRATYRNLRRIESQLVPIKAFIRTGIATLRDNVYLVEEDESGYYKTIDKQKFYIERDLVKPIYKIPELKHHNTIEEAKRFIIFPYLKTRTGFALIEENAFSSCYPKTYGCLLKLRNELDARENGKGVAQGWYAYGRTQGLNKYGRKLLFPTFSNQPSFMYVDDEEALFCNGYAVFENDCYDLDIMMKVLNSKLMDYYISNTSYSIEGGYYCYQKKYVERFSLPWFSDEDLAFIRSASKADIDDYLWTLYELE